MHALKIAAAQTPEFRESIDAALEYLVECSAAAEAENAELLVFPECFLQGYLLKESVARCHALDLASAYFTTILQKFPKTGPMVVVGLIESEGGKLFNTAIVVRHRKLIGRYRKRHLLKGEMIFSRGDDCTIFDVGGLWFGINICYDTNFAEEAQNVAALGAKLLVCPANNMFSRKSAELLKDVHNAERGKRCRETGLWMVSADVTGERDGQVSWGPTAVINPKGEVAAQLPLNQTGILYFDFSTCRE